jgi:MerR family transcriptional regulator, mercuric resistance operon regulatory protein
MAMTIGQVAQAAGVHVETIRYYQHCGLLAVPPRPAGSVRRYADDAVARLRFIRRAQEAGFTLKEIADLLRLSEEPDCRGARALAVHKLSQVEERIADLTRIRQALRRLVRQCGTGGRRSCPIIESFAAPPADAPRR